MKISHTYHMQCDRCGKKYDDKESYQHSIQAMFFLSNSTAKQEIFVAGLCPECFDNLHQLVEALLKPPVSKD